MITRPLDLASKLRPEPRNLDWLFFANAGLIVLFFSLFGSNFVLAPGLGVDFQLPSVEGANFSAKSPTHVLSVLRSGQIITNDGICPINELEGWFLLQRRATKVPIILVRGDGAVPTDLLAAIANAAKKAGIVEPVIWAATVPSDRKGQKGR